MKAGADPGFSFSGGGGGGGCACLLRNDAMVEFDQMSDGAKSGEYSGCSFKATVMHSSHCNHRFVCRSIVLVKQDSLCQFSRPSPECLEYFFSKS